MPHMMQITDFFFFFFLKGELQILEREYEIKGSDPVLHFSFKKKKCICISRNRLISQNGLGNRVGSIL